MTPYYADDWLTVYLGDCREVMATMEPESVHCVVTSPPYWGLRDYGTATWVGGDQRMTCPECNGATETAESEAKDEACPRCSGMGTIHCDHMERAGGTGKSTLGTASGGHAISEAGQVRSTERSFVPYRDTCGKCGAVRQDSQLGLEATPDAYVENMVAVFREVRRVLRSDGTVWLNLGSSYASHDPGGYRQGEHLNPGGREAAKGSGRNRAGTYVAGASGRSRSRLPERAPAYGSDGTGPQGSTGPGSAYPDLCDGCRAALSSRTTDTPRPLPAFSQLRSPIGRDTEPPGSGTGVLDALPLAAPGSTTPRSETPPPGPCSHCDNCGACLAVLRSPSLDALACVRRSGDSDGTESQSGPSAGRKTGTEPSGLAWGDYTSTIKPKDMVPIPWMVAMALQADGWYLRSDIIWSKPNPMPESVTDRPTKSHEYLFLLSKSPRYYFDADAVREDPSDASLARIAQPNFANQTGGPKDYANGTNPNRSARKTLENFAANPGRNIRTVWTIDYNTDEEVEWTNAIGFCRRCGGLRVAGNGSAPMTYSATGAFRRPANGPDRASSARIESPTRSLWGQSHEDSPSTISAATEDASTPSTSSPSPSGSTFYGETPSQPGTPSRTDASTDIPSRLRTLIHDLEAAGNVVCACVTDNGDGAPLSDVWQVATQPYPGAHFATFPPKLVEPCIKAGCPEGGTVLDPFAGSGTTAMVAQSLSRRAVLIDLNGDYLEQVMERNRAMPLGLGA